MIRVATERARAAPTLLVGVPAALEDSAPARWNRLLEHRCREAGIGFIEPSVHDDRLAPRTVLGMTAWSAETYATVASAVASALGFTVGVARGGRAGALRGGLTSRAAQLRSEHFQMLPSPAGRAVVLGDSITEGGSWSRWLPGVDVVNRGVGGDQIADVLRRLDTAVDQPTVVSLLIGTNDLAHGGDGAGVDAIVGRFGDLVLEITRRTSAPLIVNSVMPRQRRFAQRITLLNTHQRAVADEYGARWIDLWPTMATAGGAIRRELSTDGLHLNAAGYEAWARELAPAIAAALSP
ncbi:GDSL-type esterase/lipase family protein [Curtobacterium sp. VKM Ac-2887]|uniref:GDSL-type esterase/lipase family protein n=1 Tax=Curtobacterium sp. VKM Ac-2887 TaxID=2783819 RepID=UPI00188C1028|nr:GDSL-type esterase/lipase family protein [Curtobacterium sp. VKM Ac-2887]